MSAQYSSPLSLSTAVSSSIAKVCRVAKGLRGQVDPPQSPERVAGWRLSGPAAVCSGARPFQSGRDVVRVMVLTRKKSVDGTAKIQISVPANPGRKRVQVQMSVKMKQQQEQQAVRQDEVKAWAPAGLCVQCS